MQGERDGNKAHGVTTDGPLDQYTAACIMHAQI